MAVKIFVGDKLAEEGLEILKQSGMEYDVRIGLKEDELAAAVQDYDALIARANPKVTAKVLANPGKLRAIARAGLRADNIDLPAPAALDGKVKLVRDFDEFLSRIDVLTFHVPGGADTKHLLSRERLFTKCRPNLLVVNDARGEVVDEYALADALKEKRIAGAAIDVYETEPPAKDHPLFGLENAVLTPHLGASTDEAQTAVSVDAAKAIVAYLSSGEIRGAVNAGGIKLDLPADEAPFL